MAITTTDSIVRPQWYWTLPKIHKNDKKTIISDQMKSGQLGGEIKTDSILSVYNSNSYKPG